MAHLARWPHDQGEAASYAPNAAHLVATVARAWSARLLPAALLMGLAAGSGLLAQQTCSACGEIVAQKRHYKKN
ncbi:hypothetical protein [Mesorhizobium caraganae]|uniref:hypothetical protein n=1 Tax=Mesorhizobium caraganae TaxID=483206 RepID=UPI00177E88AD|nr:hypothetical protein [Mesorhizobium caraganae]